MLRFDDFFIDFDLLIILLLMPLRYDVYDYAAFFRCRFSLSFTLMPDIAIELSTLPMPFMPPPLRQMMLLILR